MVSGQIVYLPASAMFWDVGVVYASGFVGFILLYIGAGDKETETATMKIILILLVLGAVVLLIVLMFSSAGSPFLPGNSPEAARATAEAEYLLYAEPLNGEQVVAVEGMKSIVEVAEKGFDSNVKIALSADASQTALGGYIMLSSYSGCLAVVGVLVCLIVFYMILGRLGQKKSVKQIDHDENKNMN